MRNILSKFILIVGLLLFQSNNHYVQANNIELNVLSFDKVTENDCDKYLDISSNNLRVSRLQIYSLSDTSGIDGQGYIIAIKCSERVHIIISAYHKEKLISLEKLFKKIHNTIRK